MFCYPKHFIGLAAIFCFTVESRACVACVSLAGDQGLIQSFPKNLGYDTKTKSFLRTKWFKPLFEYDPSQVLAALSQWFGKDFVDPLTRAIHQHKVVKIEYCSPNSEPSIRQVAPHVLVDYDMVDGVLKQNVRAAVAGYVLRRWNVDCSEDHGLKGAEYQLWLRNALALYGVDNISLAPNYKKKNSDSNSEVTGK